MSRWAQLNNIVLDVDKVTYAQIDEKDTKTVYIYLIAGERIVFRDEEAAVAWKFFIEKKGRLEE